MGNKGLFIGLSTLDIQYFVSEHPVANTKIKANRPVIAAGGPAANAAIAYAFLGGDAYFLTAIGSNYFSDFLKNDFAKHQVKLIDVAADSVFDPIVATIITNTCNSDRTIVTHHPEKEVLSSLVTSFPDLDTFDFVFTDGFYPEISLPILQSARERQIPVIFDGGSWKPQMADLLLFVDIAICSNNFKPPGQDSITEIFKFIEKNGVKHFAISRGQDSIVSSSGEIAIDKIQAIDSLGAGDILHGAFCYFFMEDKNFYLALRKASVLASFSTLYKGTREWMEKWKK
jgi:sugar/nucleoside kinase (ribokinase family)